MTAGARAADAETKPTPVRRLTIAACVVILAGVTLWFRYRAIGIPSLWLDDAWVGVSAHFPTIGDTIQAGLTSPGFSLLYRAWSAVFGPGATAAQLLAVVFAIATPILLFFAAVERGLPVYAALLGGGLLATAPAHIDMSTRFKQYTAEALATTLVLWFAWRVLERPSSPGRWTLFTTLAIGTSLLSGIGAVMASSALAVCLIATLLARPGRVRTAVVATATYLAVVVPWMLLAVRPNVHEKLTDYWRGYYLDGTGFAGGLGTRLRVLAAGFQDLDSLLVLIGLAVAAVIVSVRRPLVGLLLLAPTLVAVSLAALSIAPIGTGRTDVYLLPTYALLVAVAVAEIAALMPARRQWLAGAVAFAAFAVAAIVATPTPTAGACVGPPVVGSTLRRCPYPQENLTPLVHLVERERAPGDEIIVYPSAGYAYGIATKYPIERRQDARAATDWVVDVRGPSITVLRANREHPERWAGPLDRLSGSPRIWLIGSHIFPDWYALTDMLEQRGYTPTRVHQRAGASLILFVKETAPNPRP